MNHWCSYRFFCLYIDESLVVHIDLCACIDGSLVVHTDLRARTDGSVLVHVGLSAYTGGPCNSCTYTDSSLRVNLGLT